MWTCCTAAICSQFKARGGQLLTSAAAETILRPGPCWEIIPRKESSKPHPSVNAAGAWGDVVAASAGVKPIGLHAEAPLHRRHTGGWHSPTLASLPMITDVGETWYAKPQSGKMIVSSADATPVDPA